MVWIDESVSLLQFLKHTVVHSADVAILKSILRFAVAKKQVGDRSDFTVNQGFVIILVLFIVLNSTITSIWQSSYSYEDLLLSGRLLALIDCKDSAAQSVLGLVLRNASLSLSGHCSQVLTESVLNMVANQHASSVGVLWVSNFWVE